MTQLTLPMLVANVGQEFKRREDRRALFQDLLKRHPGTTSKAQCLRMLGALQALGSLTTVELARSLDIFDPPARKFWLMQQGYDIRLAWDYDETELGISHRVGRYFIARDKKKGATE